MILVGPLGKNSLEIMELSSINKVRFRFRPVVILDQEEIILAKPLGGTI